MDTEKAAEGVNKFLFAPMYLVYDIFTALVPGVLFSVLLFIKQIYGPFALLNSAALGYKTKICLGLLLSYIVGRFFRIPVELLLARYLKREMGKVSKSAEPPIDFVKNFFVGALAFPQLFKKVQPLDLMVLVITNMVFTCTTGSALIVAALIPGDGILRLIEAGIGFVMVLEMTASSKGFLRTFAVLLGGMVDIQAIFGPLSNIYAALEKAAKARAAPTTGAAPANSGGGVPPTA